MSALNWIESRVRRWSRAQGSGPGGLDTECLDGRTAPGSSHCLGDECATVRLTDLRPGGAGVVSCLDDPGSPEALKLAAMGILPGAPVELRQTYPCHLFRVGESEFAVDTDLAHRIRVRVE